MNRIDFIFNGSRDEVNFMKVIASMVMPGLGQILSKKYATGICLLFGVIFTGFLPAVVFILIPSIGQLISQPFDDSSDQLLNLIFTLVNTLFLFPSIILWIFGIFHTFHINSSGRASQRFRVNIPLVIIGSVACAIGIAGVVHLFYLASIAEEQRSVFEESMITSSLNGLLSIPDAVDTLSDVTSVNVTQLAKDVQLHIQSESNQLLAGNKLNTFHLITFISLGIGGFILTLLGVTLPQMLRKTKGYLQSSEEYNQGS